MPAISMSGESRHLPRAKRTNRNVMYVLRILAAPRNRASNYVTAVSSLAQRKRAQETGPRVSALHCFAFSRD